MNASIAFPRTPTMSTQHGTVDRQRKVSLTAGILYLLTFSSIPTLALYGPVHQPAYFMETGDDTSVIIGGLLEITVALAGIATAVVLYPLLKKQNERLALGLLASRVLEAATMFVGVAFLLSIVTLKQTGAGSDALPTANALVFLYDRIFLLGQGFLPAINDVLLGTLLYKSRLVPRALSVLGIAAAFPLLAGYLAIMFGFTDRISLLAALAAVPVALFEFSLGIYLVFKGFKRNSPVLSNGQSPAELTYVSQH
jgi:hypothetical protein